jgi:hypothetical protein
MDHMDRQACGGDRRSPGAEKLTHVMSFRLSGSQRNAARAAAKRAGMAMGAWVGELVVDAVEHRALPIGWLQREVIQELIGLRREFKVAVASLDQVALALSSEDAASGELDTVIGRLRDLVLRAERVTEAVRRRM